MTDVKFSPSHKIKKMNFEQCRKFLRKKPSETHFSCQIEFEIKKEISDFFDDFFRFFF